MAIETIGFSKDDARGAPSRALRKVRAGMERDGAVRLGKIFPAPLLARMRREVVRRHESGELRERGLVRDVAGRYSAVLPFEGPFLEPAFYANPRVLAIMASLLGSDHCIGSLETVVALPGAVDQHQHIDGPLRFDRVVGGRKELYKGALSDLPPYAVTLAVPLSDISEGNGPTAIWPGSHRTALAARPPSEARVRREYPMEAMTGEMGDSFLFDYRVFHGGLANLMREPRFLLVLVFTRSWFRDPNLSDVQPGVVIGKRGLARVPERHRYLFALSLTVRRPLWA